VTSQDIFLVVVVSRSSFSCQSCNSSSWKILTHVTKMLELGHVPLARLISGSILFHQLAETSKLRQRSNLLTRRNPKDSDVLLQPNQWCSESTARVGGEGGQVLGKEEQQQQREAK
jgi:hypothetical protein